MVVARVVLLKSVENMPEQEGNAFLMAVAHVALYQGVQSLSGKEVNVFFMVVAHVALWESVQTAIQTCLGDRSFRFNENK
mmetsp:Transcript_13924/g.21376  ORF Transcript_13924/g.21376 Transcript_13924/m.21376 type:complete len:80 (+) Transcript_13924:600-839(+)